MSNGSLPGKHVLLDLYGADCSHSKTDLGAILKTAAEDCSATVLGSNLHHFGDGFGITGVVLLAESHISIHTWPEKSYIAIDIFMCGDCDPLNALPVFKKAFSAQDTEIQVITRGNDKR